MTDNRNKQKSGDRIKRQRWLVLYWRASKSRIAVISMEYIDKARSVKVEFAKDESMNEK